MRACQPKDSKEKRVEECLGREGERERVRERVRESERERERARAHARGRERVREKALGLLLLCFFLHLGLPYANWA